MVEMVAFVPQPPLLVPQLTTGRAAQSAPLRAACLDVAERLAAAADRWVALAADPGGRRSLVTPVGGTFWGYGVDVRVTLTPGRNVVHAADLPLPLLVAGWLRETAAPMVSIEAELVGPDLSTEDCRRLGAELAGQRLAHPASLDKHPAPLDEHPAPLDEHPAPLDERAGPRGLLVLGDGAITHGEHAPGYPDRRAESFDAEVAAALADADPRRLLALDAGLAAELGAAGRAPWQVLAGAVLAAGQRWHGELVYSSAPFGVAYHVALWRRR